MGLSYKEKAHKYCVDNGIRISPRAAATYSYKAKQSDKQYHVAISFPNDYKKIHKSPETYFDPEIWDKCSETEIYYYEKHISRCE